MAAQLDQEESPATKRAARSTPNAASQGLAVVGAHFLQLVVLAGVGIPVILGVISLAP